MALGGACSPQTWILLLGLSPWNYVVCVVEQPPQGCPQMALKFPGLDPASPQFRVFLVLLYALSPLLPASQTFLLCCVHI